MIQLRIVTVAQWNLGAYYKKNKTKEPKTIIAENPIYKMNLKTIFSHSQATENGTSSCKIAC